MAIMTKLIHYILIALMLNLSVAVNAEDTSKECDWKIIEETKEIGKVEVEPKLEGRQMMMVLGPLSAK